MIDNKIIENLVLDINNHYDRVENEIKALIHAQKTLIGYLKSCGVKPSVFKRSSKGYTKSTEHPEDTFRYNVKCLKVKCVETGIVYDSIRQAARMNGTHPVYVSQCINGIKETAAGYHWTTIKKPLDN